MADLAEGGVRDAELVRHLLDALHLLEGEELAAGDQLQNTERARRWGAGKGGQTLSEWVVRSHGSGLTCLALWKVDNSPPATRT